MCNLINDLKLFVDVENEREFVDEEWVEIWQFRNTFLVSSQPKRSEVLCFCRALSRVESTSCDILLIVDTKSKAMLLFDMKRKSLKIKLN